MRRQALAQPIEHFQKSVTVKDDDLDKVAILTTRKGYVPVRLIGQSNWNDEFVRGFIDKTTGRHSYQVYVILDHYSWDWIRPYQVNFGKPLVSADVLKIHRTKYCEKKKQPCERREVVGFTLPDRELRRVVETASAQDIKTKSWQFKIKGRTGPHYRGVLPLGEIIGLYRAMQAYKPVATR